MGVGIGNGVMAGALWGVVFLAPAVLLAFDALQLSAGRYLIYGLVALLLLAPRWKRLAPRIGMAEWRGLVWLSLAGNLVYFLLLATAVQWAGGAAASLIVGLIPVVVTLVAVREEGAVQLRQLAPALLLCLLGVALVGYEALVSEHVQTPWRQRVLALYVPSARCFHGRRIRWATAAGWPVVRICPHTTGLCSPAWSPVPWRCCWCRLRSCSMAACMRRPSGDCSGWSAPALR